MPKLPRVSGKEVCTALTRHGFERVRQKGSHVRMRHPDGRVASIPVHGNKDLDRGLLRRILRDTKLSAEQLLEAL